jgi:rod shape-determining protein MreC
MTPRRHTLVLGALLLGQLALLTWQVRSDTRLRLAEGSLFCLLSPVEKGVSGGLSGLGEMWSGYVELRRVHGENGILKARLRDARMRLDRMAEVERENERLRVLLGLREREGWAAVGARVVALHCTEHVGTLVLDRGSRNGIARDQAVVTEDGLVGRVVEVAPWSAKVQLLNDPSAAVAVVFEESREHATGIAFPGKAPRMEVRYLSPLARIREGEIARTSGLEGIFPPGIPVGTVSGVRERADLSLEVEMVPAVRPARLDEVLVVRTVPAEPGDAPMLAGR